MATVRLRFRCGFAITEVSVGLERLERPHLANAAAHRRCDGKHLAHFMLGRPQFHRLLHVELETRFAEESVLPVSALPMVAQQSPLEREETVSHRGRFGKREARRPGQFGTLPADESDAGAWDVATGSLGDRAGTPDHTHALRIP